MLISDRTPTTGGLVDRDSFAEALNAVKWTREEKTEGEEDLKSLTDKLAAVEP